MLVFSLLVAGPGIEGQLTKYFSYLKILSGSSPASALGPMARFRLFDSRLALENKKSWQKPAFLILVAGPGIEPGSGGYEPPEVPLLYPAM